MKEELDKQLCEKYPKIFRDRHAPMTETCMCWGFEIGDGWYPIINSLCGQIQHHIDWKNRQRDLIIRDNTIAEAGKSGNADLFADLMAEHFGGQGYSEEQIRNRAERFIKEPLQVVPNEVRQVVATQVKEKFGGLRFYYDGGDDVVDGMVRMAESWAANTCETCGKPGVMRTGGWIRTLCDEHEEERQQKYVNKDIVL